MLKIRAARDKGDGIYTVAITLNRDCVMKEARAFLVITNLKKLGEIIKSSPDVENLKEGKFGFSFIILLASKEEQRVIRQELFNISEIESVTIEALQLKEKAAAESKVSGPAQPGQAARPQYVKKIQSMRIAVQRLDKIMNPPAAAAWPASSASASGSTT